MSVVTKATYDQSKSMQCVWEALDGTYKQISEYSRLRPEGAYTTKLYESNLDQTLKKIGEEAIEVLLAAKAMADNDSPKKRKQLTSELADLLFHLLVTVERLQVDPTEFAIAIEKRKF